MADRRARRELERLAEEVVPLLIARLDRSELGELEVRDGAWRVRVRRGGAGEEVTTVAATGSAAGRDQKGPRRATAGRRRTTAEGSAKPAAATGAGAQPARSVPGSLGTPSGNGETAPLEPVG